MKYFETNDEVKNTYKSSSIVMNNMAPILFLIFLVLKLTNQIDWSWWWVTSPLWISFAILLILIVIALVTKFVITFYKSLTKKN
jgi:membrane protein YdbS with pleckstrin-like domain